MGSVPGSGRSPGGGHGNPLQYPCLENPMDRGAWWATVSVQFSRSVMSDSFIPYTLQQARPSCSSPTPRVYSTSCPLSQWCQPTISSSVIPFSSHLQSFPASGSFPVSQFFASVGQSTGVSASASILPMSIQDWFPLGLTGWISLQSQGLFKNVTYYISFPLLFLNFKWYLRPFFFHTSSRIIHPYFLLFPVEMRNF